MLIHIRPMMLTWHRAVLIDLDLHPFGLHLVGGKDLNAGHPYPNRLYTVGCRKDRRKITDGILIETGSFVPRFRATARWGIDAERIVTSVVDYDIVDHDFDAVSDHAVLWHAWDNWKARWDFDVTPEEPRFEDETPLQTHYFPMPTLERERLTGEVTSEITGGRRFPTAPFRV